MLLKRLFLHLKIPALNTSFNEEAGEIVHKHYWNIGIAADTEEVY